MKWSLVLLILLVQETVTVNGLLVKVHQGASSIWLVTILFLFFTVIEIFFGYWLGTYAKRQQIGKKKGKVRTFAKKWTQYFNDFIGKHGRRVYMVLLGYFSFPYLNAFIMAWLEIPLIESFGYLFIGNILFYVTSWLLVLGVASIVPNPFFALLAVLALTVGITILMRVWKSRKV